MILFCTEIILPITGRLRSLTKIQINDKIARAKKHTVIHNVYNTRMLSHSNFNSDAEFAETPLTGIIAKNCPNKITEN